MNPFRKNPLKWLFYGYFVAAFSVKRLRGERRSVAVNGEPVVRPYLQWKIFQLLGLEVIHDPRARAALRYAHYFDTTRGEKPGLNGRCTDISKSRVAEAFAHTFGYALAIDPMRHTGKLVRKSEANAVHDGVVLQGPLPVAEPGFSYQRLLDGRGEDGLWTDLRPCVIGQEIPFVYIKKRSAELMFANEGNRVRSVPADAVFSAEEQVLLLAFCRRMGLDLGELDVIRDAGDGRLYVVDVASTPHSPGDAYIGVGGIRCMLAAADSFRRQFLEPLAQSS